MSTLSSNSRRLAQSSGGNETLRGALVGLISLVLLAAFVVLALALAAFARQMTATAGFFAQQQAALIVLIAGLALAFVVYVVAIVLIFRRIAAWQQNGIAARARSALWVLGVTALIAILPLILAIVLPQHPAP